MIGYYNIVLHILYVVLLYYRGGRRGGAQAEVLHGAASPGDSPILGNVNP